MSEQSASTSAGWQEQQNIEYGRFYYRHDCGVPYERNDHWLGFFEAVADGIIRELRPASVLDAGCAMGFLVEALRNRGVDAHGIDVSEYAISRVDDSVREYCKVQSLTEPIEGRYDLVVCIEVLEHIPAAEVGAAIANICASTDRLLLSTTPDDYGEPTHLNVQPPEAWAAALAREGFFRDVERNASFVTPWASVFMRELEPLDAVVRRYDRAWWRLRREDDQLRDSLLSAQQRLAELEEQPEKDRPELLTELDRRQEEILKLRDRLIGMQSELGTAKGRVAEYEDRAKRLANVKRQIEAKIPVFGKLAGKLWTLVSGRGG